MPRTLQDVRTALEALAERWKGFQGTEKAASQTFLNELISAYTGATDAMAAGARLEEFGGRDDGSGFMDLYWPGVAIIEMKAPNQTLRLDQHRAQALDYWRNSADAATHLEAPGHLVLCSFGRFEIWEPGRFPPRAPDYAPLDAFDLADLPNRAEALLFLAGRTPIYGGPGEDVSAKAAQLMVDLYFSLVDREAGEPEDLRRFILQSVWALFAEDLRMLEGMPIGTLTRALIADPGRSSAVELMSLYQRMNIKPEAARNPAGLSPKVPYVNGDLFASAAPIHLEQKELRKLLEASEFDWQHVNPTVFGALFEGCVGRDRRWELGAHYTSEADIRQIVEPVIVRPWVKRIEAVSTYSDAKKLLDELCAFKILDPAMGCSNFLVISYREMRQLEARLHEKLQNLALAEGRNVPLELSWYPISNIQGMEIEPFVVEISRATLWMTHALEVRKLGSGEAVLPLPSLPNLVCADALKTPWPETDAIVGNPPFHGDRNLRRALGDDYIAWLQDEFGVGVKDHCVYFFLRAHQNLKPGQRAGLVATKTISQTRNRDASLVPMLEAGSVITDAISSQPWSGEAAVHVSIICWQKPPTDNETTLLDGRLVDGITPSLTEGTGHRAAVRLAPNRGICFIGYYTRGMGFVLKPEEALSFLRKHGEAYRDVVAPFVNGNDTTTRPDQSPSRWVIDLADMPLELAQRDYPHALDIVRERVLPDRLNDPKQMVRWWQFWNTRKGLRQATAGLSRFAICSVVGKRLLLVWAEPNWRPSHACNCFAFEDDYNFGVCSSRVHELWVRANSSTLEDRLRYTPSTAFDTFPFPTPTEAQRNRIAAAARTMVERRAEACASTGHGLTRVYNTMDEGGHRDLNAAHRELDTAVLEAYGLTLKHLDEPRELLATLYDLNLSAAKDPAYQPFGTRAGITELAEDD